jgi:hypothetical protein
MPTKANWATSIYIGSKKLHTTNFIQSSRQQACHNHNTNSIISIKSHACHEWLTVSLIPETCTSTHHFEAAALDTCLSKSLDLNDCPKQILHVTSIRINSCETGKPPEDACGLLRY